MKAITPTFGVTDDNELYFCWVNGNRHLTLYINPPDSEDGPMDCFGSTGPYNPMPEFESIHEGYRWLVEETVKDGHC